MAGQSFATIFVRRLGASLATWVSSGGTIYIHAEAFPATLPKLALSIRYRIALDDARLEDVNISLFLPGDGEDKPSLMTAIPISEMIKTMGPPASPGDQFREFGANIVLGPLTLKEKGRICVRAVGGAGQVKLGSLNHRSAASSDGAAPLFLTLRRSCGWSCQRAIFTLRISAGTSLARSFPPLHFLFQRFVTPRRPARASCARWGRASACAGGSTWASPPAARRPRCRRARAPGAGAWAG